MYQFVLCKTQQWLMQNTNCCASCPTQESNAAWLNEECNCRSAVVRCSSLYVLIGVAYSQDEGAFYKELVDVHKAYALQGATRKTAT